LQNVQAIQKFDFFETFCRAALQSLAASKWSLKEDLSASVYALTLQHSNKSGRDIPTGLLPRRF
jgi:hypothetical protein